MEKSRFTSSGERVRLTGNSRDMGMGEQLEVIYSDGSKGFEHGEDLHKK